MDDSAFDRLVRSFAAPDSRRTLLRLLTALPLTGALASFGEAKSEASQGQRRHRHDPHEHQAKTPAKRKHRHKRNKRTPSVPPAGAGDCLSLIHI